LWLNNLCVISYSFIFIFHSVNGNQQLKIWTNLGLPLPDYLKILSVAPLQLPNVKKTVMLNSAISLKFILYKRSLTWLLLVIRSKNKRLPQKNSKKVKKYIKKKLILMKKNKNNLLSSCRSMVLIYPWLQCWWIRVERKSDENTNISKKSILNWSKEYLSDAMEK
jgi:hypothetical protein